LLAASFAAAQEPPPRYKSVVQSDRPALPNGDGGSSVVLSSQEIERLPAGPDLRLSDVLVTQAGMTADSFGQVHVRGHYAHLLYRLDGVPLPSTFIEQFVALVPVRALQSLALSSGGLQAEVGGQIGGVVDLQLKDFTRPDGAVSVRYGSYNTVEPSLVYGRTVGKLSFLVAGDYQRTDRGLDPPAVSPILHDQAQSGHALAHVTYRAGAQDVIGLNVAFVQAAFQIPINPSLQPLVDGVPIEQQRRPDLYGNAPNRFVPRDADPTERERDVLATLSYRHQFRRGGALQSSLYFRRLDASLACDPARALGATADPGTSCSDVVHTAFQVGAVLDATLSVGRRHILQAGFWLNNQESDVRYHQYSRNDANPTLSPNAATTLGGEDKTRTEYLGLYAQDQIRIGRVTLFPGVRFDLQNVGAETQSTTLFLKSPSARLGATWAPSLNWSLHAYVGYLWQPPSLDAPTAGRALGLIPAGQPVVYDLRAEGDWYAELGVAGRPLSGLVMSLIAWGRLMDSPLDDQEVGDTNLKAEYNYERGRAYGLELSTTFVFGP
jgi:hypothetical protein